MDDLLGLLPLLILVFGSLFSFFGKKEEENNKKTTVPKPAQPKRPVSTKEPISQGKRVDSYFGEKQAQIDKLKGQLEISNKEDDHSTKRKEVVQKKEIYATKKSRKSAFSIGKSLSKEGLAESVIMAEVLGSPRSKKPYQYNSFKK